MDWIQAHWEILALIAINLLGLAAAVAKLTPTTTDDEWIAKIQAVVEDVVKAKK